MEHLNKRRFDDGFHLSELARDVVGVDIWVFEKDVLYVQHVLRASGYHFLNDEVFRILTMIDWCSADPFSLRTPLVFADCGS